MTEGYPWMCWNLKGNSIIYRYSIPHSGLALSATSGIRSAEQAYSVITNSRPSTWHNRVVSVWWRSESIILFARYSVSKLTAYTKCKHTDGRSVERPVNSVPKFRCLPEINLLNRSAGLLKNWLTHWSTKHISRSEVLPWALDVCSDY